MIQRSVLASIFWHIGKSHKKKVMGVKLKDPDGQSSSSKSEKIRSPVEATRTALLFYDNFRHLLLMRYIQKSCFLKTTIHSKGCSSQESFIAFIYSKYGNLSLTNNQVAENDFVHKIGIQIFVGHWAISRFACVLKQFHFVSIKML